MRLYATDLWKVIGSRKNKDTPKPTEFWVAHFT
jgi:hypothetical protein